MMSTPTLNTGPAAVQTTAVSVLKSSLPGVVALLNLDVTDVDILSPAVDDIQGGGQVKSIPYGNMPAIRVSVTGSQAKPGPTSPTVRDYTHTLVVALYYELEADARTEQEELDGHDVERAALWLLEAVKTCLESVSDGLYTADGVYLVNTTGYNPGGLWRNKGSSAQITRRVDLTLSVCQRQLQSYAVERRMLEQALLTGAEYLWPLRPAAPTANVGTVAGSALSTALGHLPRTVLGTSGRYPLGVITASDVAQDVSADRTLELVLTLDGATTSPFETVITTGENFGELETDATNLIWRGYNGSTVTLLPFAGLTPLDVLYVAATYNASEGQYVIYHRLTGGAEVTDTLAQATATVGTGTVGVVAGSGHIHYLALYHSVLTPAHRAQMHTYLGL